MTNILFLDYDGCINTLDVTDRRGNDIVINGESLFDTLHIRELIDNINMLTSRYSMDIVLISSWREHYSVDEMRTMMKIMGLSANLHGYITTLELDLTYRERLEYEGSSAIYINRALQINRWLELNSVENFLIIDDNVNCGHFHRDKFIHTDRFRGFDSECYINSIARFDNIFGVV